MQTVFSGMVTLGFRLAYDYNLPSIGFGILKLKTPTKVIPGIKHSTVDRELDSVTGPRALLRVTRPTVILVRKESWNHD